MGQEGAEITAYDISQFAVEGGGETRQGGLDTPQTTSAEQPPDGEFFRSAPVQAHWEEPPRGRGEAVKADPYQIIRILNTALRR